MIFFYSRNGEWMVNPAIGFTMAGDFVGSIQTIVDPVASTRDFETDMHETRWRNTPAKNNSTCQQNWQTRPKYPPPSLDCDSSTLQMLSPVLHTHWPLLRLEFQTKRRTGPILSSLLTGTIPTGITLYLHPAKASTRGWFPSSPNRSSSLERKWRCGDGEMEWDNVIRPRRRRTRPSSYTPTEQECIWDWRNGIPPRRNSG